MITVLHGDHVEASRLALNQMISKAKDAELRRFDGKTMDPTALIQAAESSSLFGRKPLVVIEHLFGGKNKKSKQHAQIIDTLKQAADTCDIIVWEDKALDATTLASLGKPAVQLFKIPVKIFQLLDSIAPQSAASLLTTYATIGQQDAPELVFAMIVKRLRLLLVIADGSKPVGLADWQAARLTKQASFFTMEQLTSMHTNLLHAEYGIKTGTSAYQLSELLEQFFISL